MISGAVGGVVIVGLAEAGEAKISDKDEDEAADTVVGLGEEVVARAENGRIRRAKRIFIAMRSRAIEDLKGRYVGGCVLIWDAQPGWHVRRIDW